MYCKTVEISSLGPAVEPVLGPDAQEASFAQAWHSLHCDRDVLSDLSCKGVRNRIGGRHSWVWVLEVEAFGFPHDVVGHRDRFGVTCCSESTALFTRPGKCRDIVNASERWRAATHSARTVSRRVSMKLAQSAPDAFSTGHPMRSLLRSNAFHAVSEAGERRAVVQDGS